MAGTAVSWNGLTYTVPGQGDTGYSAVLGLSGLVVSLATYAVHLTAAQTLTNKILSGNTATTLISGSGTLTLNTSGTITLPNATDTLVGKATTDILTNKTLSGNIAVTLISGSGTLTLNTSGTIAVPNATDTLVGKATTDVLTNKSLSDTTCTFVNAADATKVLKTDLSGAAAGKTATLAFPVTNNRTITFPDSTATLATTFASSQVICDTGNGHGSTNTKIRIFTNATTTGSDITYATSATNGDTFTVNTAGIYSVTYTDDKSTGSCTIGISVNSNQLTTAIGSITTAHRLHLSDTSAATFNTHVTGVVRCAANDVIRAHTDGTPNNGTATAQFRVVRIA